MFILYILKNPEILFGFITFLMLICSILVITNKNPIHSILFLVLIFIITTVLFLILNVDFLAMLFLVLYVGAIVVLFLFVVMMLNVRILELRERVISYLPIAVIIAIVFLLLIVSILRVNFITPSSTYSQEQNNDIFQYFYNLLSINTEHLSFIDQAQFWTYFAVDRFDNLNIISAGLYKDYAYLFLLAGIVLLVAMLGAIVLTHNNLSKSKRQDYYSQTNKDIKKAIRHLK